MSVIINWTILNPVHVYEWFSPELKETAANLNSQIEGVKKRRKEIDERLAGIENADVDKVEFTTLVFCADHVEAVTLLLQDELAIRRHLSEFYERHEPERRGEADAAAETHRKAQEEVTKALVKIGYVDAPRPSERVIGRIQPGWIAEHPKVHATLQRVQGLRSDDSFRQHVNANQAAVEHVTEQLTAFRRKAMGTLGPATRQASTQKI